MGKRKLVFDARKNYERKKYAKLNVCVPLHLLDLQFSVSLPLKAYESAPAESLQTLYTRLLNTALPQLRLELSELNSCITLYKVQCNCPTFTAEVAFSLVIYDNFTWRLNVGSHLLLSEQLPSIPEKLPCIQDVTTILNILENSRLCIGNPDEKYASQYYKVTAYKDMNGITQPTIRHHECSILVSKSGKSRCNKCATYRKSLNKTLHNRSQVVKPHSHTNYRYLTSTERIYKLREMQQKNRFSQKRIACLTEKLKEVTLKSGICVDDAMNADLQEVMQDADNHVKEQYPKDSFMYLFWQQQKEASRKHPKGMRWHPLMIRWCLLLRHQSGKAYETLRDAGIALPSQRTLRDYTYSYSSSRGKEIKWQHLIDLYEQDRGKSTGLALLPNLKYEHIHLTSFSKMRVDLATQVLSNSVSKALMLVIGTEAEETARFAAMLDRYFDTLNVSNFTQGKRSRKPFQNPYYSCKDFRLKWLEEEFIPYLNTWEESVKRREGFTKDQKKRMMLSHQTMLGLRTTALSFMGLVKFLFSQNCVTSNNLALLSNNLCQDPLEQFFGCQRQRGGTADNPNVLQFCQNTQALRVIDSFCRGPVKGNCKRKREHHDTENLVPLVKRPRKN